MNSERYPPPHPQSQHPLASAAPAPAPAPVAPEGEFQKASRGDSQTAAGNRPSQQAKAERDERRGRRQPTKGRFAGQRRLLRSHNLDLKGTAIMHSGIDTQMGKLCGRGKKIERKA